MSPNVIEIIEVTKSFKPKALCFPKPNRAVSARQTQQSCCLGKGDI